MRVLKRDRPTIGVLLGWSVIRAKIPDLYTLSVLRGIQAAARVKECHLLEAWGLGRVTNPDAFYPAWPIVAPDSDFAPVGPWNTDGLIVLAPLRSEARSTFLRQLGDRGFPVVFIANGDGEPSIAVDNAQGIREALLHLIGHGHKKVAFIAGDPEDKGDSELRLQAFHAGVAEYGLSADPRLIVPGRHLYSMGYDAASQIVHSQVGATAILASNDVSAIGAMHAIHDAGLEIPGDIAVIGFDDQPDAVAQIPPLTSVHIPLREMGQQALLMMLAHLVEDQPLESLRIPARLVQRQSCGCIPKVVYSAADRVTHLPPSLGRAGRRISIQEAKRLLAEEMVAALPSAASFSDEATTRLTCMTLVGAFYEGLEAGNAAGLQTATTSFLHQLELTDGNIGPWQDIISALRREMTLLPLSWHDPKVAQLAEDMLHQMRAAISESAQRSDSRHRAEQEMASQILSELTAALSVTLDEQQAVQVLESRLENIRVRNVRVLVFQPDGDDPVALSKLLGSGAASFPQPFATRDFPPAGLYPQNESLCLALIPLVFQDEPIGYMACAADNTEPFPLIARQLAASFKTSRLYAQVRELSLTDALTGLSNRRYFDLFLRNEVERSARFAQALSVIMLDIDHFKDYNDAYGHPAGDRALQAVAECIQSNRRAADMAARVGGEEFALILPNTRVDGALVLASRIRAAVEKIPRLERRITLSAGISMLTGNISSADELVAQADLALYEAKRGGRDRISVYNGG